jgi:hypothetical protein
MSAHERCSERQVLTQEQFLQIERSVAGCINYYNQAIHRPCFVIAVAPYMSVILTILLALFVTFGRAGVTVFSDLIPCIDTVEVRVPASLQLQ